MGEVWSGKKDYCFSRKEVIPPFTLSWPITVEPVIATDVFRSCQTWMMDFFGENREQLKANILFAKELLGP